jgi:hypothetical protein
MFDILSLGESDRRWLIWKNKELLVGPDRGTWEYGIAARGRLVCQARCLPTYAIGSIDYLSAEVR